MKIAVVGAGIAGSGAALALIGAGHDVTVFEKEPRSGGHSATVDVDWDGVPMAADTGFIVYNELNYPNFVAMLAWLGVETQPSGMSFSVSRDGGRFEWCGRDTRTFSGLFAQKRNLLSVSYLSMLREILRFQKTATEDLRAGRIGGETLGQYFERHGFSKRLRDDYAIPMGAAIWSMSPKAMLGFPARAFVTFFDNHRLLQWDRPVWRTVTGGSRSYVTRIAEILGPRLRTKSAIVSLARGGGGVEIADSAGNREKFDHAIVAAHAPQALAMLSDASDDERAILGAMTASDNDVWLHRDERLMPRRKQAWAAWNFLRAGDDDERKVSVTYWMNALQALDRARPVFVSLNPIEEPRAELTFGRFSYAHPQFDARAIAAQAALPRIQGVNLVSFCGAWTTYGFHEDGLVSGLGAAKALGASAPWLQPELRMAAQ